ncbi:MAG: hypothetical protein HYW07_10230 [Candidatus Latescibacteria bacterium]|nr:hypothetical protein [Candidatus Latescibacterota bacterium]
MPRSEKERRAVRTELEALKAERLALLDELETTYKQLEEALSTKNYETEITYQELRKRNQELQQRLAELQETQHMLVHSERLSAMGQMAAAIVHEINNPLTVLSGRVQMLLARERLEYRDELMHIREATRKLAEMTRNILRFARRKRLDQVALALDLNPLIEEMLNFFLPLMKKIEFRTDLAPVLPQVWGNAAQIEQVMTNLMVNAADALEEQPERGLLVSTGMGSLAGILATEQKRGWETRFALPVQEGDLHRDRVFASVADNGPGIGAENMDQLFEAFFTTKGADKGTGLGLAICRSIAENLQGNILVASKVGEGTIFRLVLQLADDLVRR